MAEKKLSAFALLEILKTETDENHLLGPGELLNKMRTIYDCNIERRTLYTNIEMLREFGYDIHYNSSKKGYYLVEREFEESEILLLCHAVHSSNYIPKKYSNDLIEKLLNTQSRHTAARFHQRIYLENIRKKENPDFLLSFQMLVEAIEKKVCVQVDYLQYNLELELEVRKTHVLHPYALVCDNEKNYLIAKNERFNDFSHYRVDKIRNVQLLDKQVSSSLSIGDPYEYARNKIYMFGGQEDTYMIRCEMMMLDYVIDTFGKNIRVTKQDDHHFVARVKAGKEGIIYFALQYAKHMEILEPEETRQQMKELLEEVLDRYQQ